MPMALSGQNDTSTMLNPVTVVYNEDPAISIIRNAIKSYKQYEKIRPDNIKFYAAQKVGGRELSFEQVATVYFSKTSTYQEVEAFKDYQERRADFGTSVEVSTQFNLNSDFDFNEKIPKGTFNEFPLSKWENSNWTPLERTDNNLLSAGSIPGLFAAGSLYRTTFKLQSERQGEMGHSYTIFFEPKMGEGWRGSMIITGRNYRIASIEAEYESIRISQDFNLNGPFYVRKLQWEFGDNLYTQEVLALNTTQRPKKKRPMLVAFIPENVESDPNYWQQYRPKDDVIDAWTRKQDSLIRFLNSDEYLDSADAEYNKFHWYEPLVTGIGYRKRSKGTSFYYSPLIGQWNFVGIGGTRWVPALRTTKRFSNYQSLSSSLAANYGLLNNDLKGALALDFVYAPLHNGSISLNLGDIYDPITQSVDLAGVFARSNFVRKKTFEMYHRYEWFNGFYTRLGIEYSNRESIEGLQFAQWSNDLFGTRNEPTPFDAYTVAQLGVEILIRPFQRYYLKGRQKIPLSSKWPDFRLVFKQGIPSFLGSDVRYSKYEFVVDDMLRFGQLGESFYRFTSGGFLNDPTSVRFIEYKWFRGGDFYLFTHPLYTYQSLPLIDPSPSVYFTGSLIHHFDGFMLGKIPLVKRLSLGSSIGASFLSVPAEDIHHLEAYVGLERKVKLWDTPMRFGIHYLFQPTDAAGGFRWKVSMDVKDTFTDRWNY